MPMIGDRRRSIAFVDISSHWRRARGVSRGPEYKV